MNRLIYPFGLKNRIKSPSLAIDAIPLLDIILIAFLISLISSKFLFAPGIKVDLPESKTALSKGVSTPIVLTVNQSNLIFFEGNMYRIEDLEKTLSNYIKDSKQDNKVLLAKISKQTSMDTLYQICEIAKATGFTEVQIAGNISHPIL